jgi:hypothetical protein
MDKTTSPAGLANLGPLAQLKAGRMPERLLRLLLGLWLYGLSIALMIKGTVGAAPWDVFHQGAALHLPLSFGVVMILASVVVLLATPRTTSQCVAPSCSPAWWSARSQPASTWARSWGRGRATG